MFLSVSGVDRFMPVVTALRSALQHRGPGLTSLLRATCGWPELAIRSRLHGLSGGWNPEVPRYGEVDG